MNISPMSQRVIHISNLLRSGVSIDFNDFDVLFWEYVEYFSRLREQKEKQQLEEARFKVLGQMLSKIFGGR